VKRVMVRKRRVKEDWEYDRTRWIRNMRKRRKGRGEKRIGKGIVYQNFHHFMPVTVTVDASLTMKPTRIHISCFKKIKTRLQHSRIPNINGLTPPNPCFRRGGEGGELWEER